MVAKTKSVAGPASDLNLLRAIPKVDEVLSWLATDPPAPLLLVKSEVRKVLEEYRGRILAGEELAAMELQREQLLPRLLSRLIKRSQNNFRPVINATGVVVHTNLGRSLLPAAAMAQLAAVGGSYSNLEFDLASGKRGSRYSLVEELLRDLTGAEAAVVVNNNAAAVLLVLETLAKGREVIVSRGQLVEIGGSFRIPEVMARRGARLVEVGATNRTHLRDYEGAITPETALLLKVHTSNYRQIGFTSEVEAAELAALGGRHGLPVVEDLGSGSLLDLSRFGLVKEPTVQGALRAGVDLLTFSGDKLLGGPQAGLILGKKELVDRVRQNPLNRALRIDKFTLAALESVLRLYYDEERACREIPTLRMLTMPLTEIRRRAGRLRRLLGKELAECYRLELLAVDSRVGGGALPELALPSCAVSLNPAAFPPSRLERVLREAEVPVIGRIENEHLLLDLRTVADHELPGLAATLRTAYSACL